MRILLIVILIGALTSCSASKDVYRLKGDKWSAGPKKSAVTGWTYTK